MAYTRSKTRRRTSRNTRAGQQPAGSPHPIILTVTWLLTGLSGILLLPAAPILLTGMAIARTSAKRPDLSGQDAWKQPVPASAKERRQDKSWRRIRAWFTPCASRLNPTNPILPAIAAGAALAALPVHAKWGEPWAFLQFAATIPLIAAWPATPQTGPIHCGPRPVTWARKQASRILACAGIGLAAGIGLWVWVGNPYLPIIPIGLLTPLPMLAAWKASRRQYHADRQAARMLNDWLAGMDKPPVDRPPTGLDGTITGPYGEIVARLTVSQANVWQDKKIRDQFRIPATRQGRDIAFSLDGADNLHVIVNIAPLQPPDPNRLIADKTSLTCYANMETARLCNNYNATGGKSQLQQVGTRDNQPACWVWRMDGGSADSDWEMIRRDWLRGSTAGELGDWGTLIGIRMIVDPGLAHAWLYTEPLDTIQFDEPKATKQHCRAFSSRTDGDTHAYLKLAVQSQQDMALWEDALSGGKLEPPMQIIYDRRIGADRLTSRDGMWALEQTPMSIPTKGGWQATDYMKTDLRAAFGDSTIADIVGMRNRGKWFTRYMQFIQSVPANNPATPTQLRQLTGDGLAERTLAQVIISRGFAHLLKHAAYVDLPRQCAADNTGWTMWRTDIQLTGGDTGMDARKAAPRLQSMLGCDMLLWDWHDAASVTLWAGDQCPADPDMWDTVRDQRDALRLRLDEAWSAAKLLAPDGRGVTTVNIRPWQGRLTRLDFHMPAGFDRDMLTGRLDTFLPAAGYAYGRPLVNDTADPSMFSLLVCEGSPLPDKASLDLHLVKPGDSRLPFAVKDDGSIAWFDPASDPHLLASGTTGSGKSSVSVSLVLAALTAGWQVLVTDPSKGANDFKPLADKLAAFEPSLEGCYALFQYAYREMRRRVQLVADHGGGDWSTLPADIRPPRMLIFCDEFNSLLQKDKAKLDNPNDDPDVANEITLAAWRNGLRASIGLWVSKLLTQARSAGITLLLGAQQLNAGDLDLLPNASTAKGMLARVFLGVGQPQGNVSQANVREVNRLHRQATASGGMPKGRGVYERLGRGVDMVQCFWPGKGDELNRYGPFPRMEPVDLTPFMPAPPELTGLTEQSMIAGVEQAGPVVVDESDAQWAI